MEEFINTIDFKLLRCQRRVLIATINSIDRKENPIQVQSLAGILHMVDRIQELAVKEYDKPVMDVYDL